MAVTGADSPSQELLGTQNHAWASKKGRLAVQGNFKTL